MIAVMLMVFSDTPPPSMQWQIPIKLTYIFTAERQPGCPKCLHLSSKFQKDSWGCMPPDYPNGASALWASHSTRLQYLVHPTFFYLALPLFATTPLLLRY